MNNRLFQDATDFFRLVESIRALCGEQLGAVSYADESGVFFKYVHDLAEATIQYLRGVVQSPGTNLDVDRQGLRTLKKCWVVLHQFVKPVADADSLATPGPLLRFLQETIRRSVSEAMVVLLATPSLNYFQHPTTGLKQMVAQLPLHIPGAPRLREPVGFISIPYTQGAALLMNTLICHEMGHFVFEERSLADELSPHLQAALQSAESKLQPPDPTARAWLRDRLLAWSQEIFCDLFAINMIGPAYALAYLDFRVLGQIDANSAVQFHLHHPADACRFRQHQLALRRQGWWSAIENFKCEHISLIDEFSAIPEADYKLALPFQQSALAQLENALIPAFLDLLPEVSQLSNDTLASDTVALQDFISHHEEIFDYLAEAVVPSTLSRGYCPAPLVLVNATAFFLKVHLGRLAVRTAVPDDLGTSADLYSRVEGWAMKAIEDYTLFTQGVN